MDSAQSTNSSRALTHTCLTALTTDVPLVKNPQLTLGDAEKYLLSHTKSLESINYLYITDPTGKLVGVISIKDIFRNPKRTKLETIMTTDVVTVRPHTKLERAAYLAVSHNLKALPVVDHDGKFQGAITSDTILDTLYREMQADIFSFAGVHHPTHTLYQGDSVLKLPILTSVWHRIPWLIVGLLGGLLISKIIHLFEDSITTNILIASFIPLVVYMANAIGIQMETFIIRDYAINPHIRFLPYFTRHAAITTLISVIISYLFFWITAFFYKDYWFSIIISTALFVTIISSLLTGLLIPYLFEKLRMDPASAGGPVGTIIQDGISVVIYLSIAAYLL